MTTPGLSLIAPCDTPLPDLHLHLQAGNGRNTIRKVATVAGENLRGDRLTPTGSGKCGVAKDHHPVHFQSLVENFVWLIH